MQPVANGPVVSDDVKKIDAPVEILALKTLIQSNQAKTEEVNSSVTKLKSSIQEILKKIKEEFTINKTETATAIENLQKEVKANSSNLNSGAPVLTAEASAGNALVELAALKTLTEASQTELKAKIEEANGSVAKLKSSIQEILKKIKEEFTVNKSDTTSIIDNLTKEVNALKEKSE